MHKKEFCVKLIIYKNSFPFFIHSKYSLYIEMRNSYGEGIITKRIHVFVCSGVVRFLGARTNNHNGRP